MKENYSRQKRLRYIFMSTSFRAREYGTEWKFASFARCVWFLDWQPLLLLDVNLDAIADRPRELLLSNEQMHLVELARIEEAITLPTVRA